MIKTTYAFLLGSLLCMQNSLNAQVKNCFLEDFEAKKVEIPASVDVVQPSGKANVLVKFSNDTISKISKYVFGNAVVAWAGSYTNTEFIEGVKLLQPSLLRWPGGSWANGWFLDKYPTDIPDSGYDGTTYNGKTAVKVSWSSHHTGTTGGWITTTDQYYKLRQNAGVNEGLISVNYAYARYCTSKNPVAQAAHEAARWVRYDAGRTKFWEIGNENSGPWEPGWMIDTALNQDGQPQIINGGLYGKHFKVFADSMRNAAKEIGATIYIGGVVVASTGATGYWADVESTWNKEFFKEVGDTVDFYVVHNYFANSYTVKEDVNGAIYALKSNADYLKKDIIKYGGALKPFALTEYNMNGDDKGKNSYVNGMQAVVLICEQINNNFSMGVRWEISSLFWGEGNYANHPHADFYYLTYLQKIIGDMAFTSSSSNASVVSYTSRYSSSGEVAMVLVNEDTAQKIITVSTDSIRVGSKYYVYSFTGGTDTYFSRKVSINGNGPNSYQWGPYDDLSDIKADAFTIDNEIKIVSPGNSVQMVLFEAGNKQIIVKDFTGVRSSGLGSFELAQNYPNPVYSNTQINFELPERVFVSLKVYDFQGKEITTLVSGNRNAGKQSVQFNTSGLKSGIYYYKMEAGRYNDVKKLIIMK